MQDVSKERQHYITAQVNLAEHLAAMLYNQVGQIRVGMNDPDFTYPEWARLVSGFREESLRLLATFDRIQATMTQEKLPEFP